MSKLKSSVNIPERQQTEQAQRSTDELFRALIENTADIITISDAEGAIRYESPSVERVLGYKPAELIGVNIVELLHPEDVPKMNAAIKAIAPQNGTPGIAQFLEVRLRHKDGSWRMMEGIGKVLVTSSVTGIVVNYRDITERKRTEEELRASDALLQSAINILPVGLWIFDAEGKIVISSAAAQQIWAGVRYIDVGQLGEYKGWRTDSGKLIEAHEWAGARAFEKGETSIEEEVEIECFDGTHKIILDTAVPLRKSDGSIGGAITINQDITERKRAEEALQESEEKYRTLFTSSSDAIMLVEPLSGKFISENQTMIKMFGLKNDDGFSSFGPWDFSPERQPDGRVSAEKAKEMNEIAMRDGSNFFEWTHKRLNGEEFSANIRLTRMVLDKRTLLQATTRDITERKQAEEALRQERELYLDLVNTQPAGIYRLRVLSGKFLSEEKWRSSKDAPYSLELVSDRFCEILKLDRQAFHDNPGIVNDLVFEADKEEFGRKNIEANSRMIPFIWEGRLVIGGALLWVHLESHPRPLEDGDTLWTGILYDITERKRAEDAVQASLRGKEILLREIHHRVKNNMQIISSLFNLQSGHIKDEDARRMLKEGQLRIRSMALVHEKLYQSRDLSKIDFADYLRSLSVHLFHFFMIEADRIRLETDLEDVHLDINSAVPCGLLLTELITNALKHAFPGDRKGVIGLGLHRRKDGTVELRVSDDGVGFPEAVDFRKTESLGLQIVDLLVGQLEGTIELDRKKGTAFTVVFRELEYKART